MRRTVELWKRILVCVLLCSMVMTQSSITVLAQGMSSVPMMTVSDAEQTDLETESVSVDVSEMFTETESETCVETSEEAVSETEAEEYTETEIFSEEESSVEEETEEEVVTIEVATQESVEQESTVEEETEETVEETTEETAKIELVADNMDILVKVEADSVEVLPDDTYLTAIQVPVIGQEGEIEPIDNTEDVLYM